MKPGVVGLCLVLLFTAGMVSVCPGDCPTCVFAYDSNGLLLDANPYAGCPTCVFDYDADGNLIQGSGTGCSSCSVVSGTTNTLGDCSSCRFSSAVSPATVSYTFPDGTPVPEEYICPIHGIYCPDDPRPLEERPGYIAPTPTIRPTLAPRVLPDTSVEFISLFKRPSSRPMSDRFAALLSRY